MTRVILNPRAVYTLPQCYSQIRTLYYTETREQVMRGGVTVSRLLTTDEFVRDL